MYHTSHYLSTILLTLTLCGTHGFLKGSWKNNNIQTRRQLASDSSCSGGDDSVKVLDSSDCGINLSSANNYDDSLIVLDGNMECGNLAEDQAVITISASRVTLDCQNNNILITEPSALRRKTHGIRITGNNVIVQNCDVSRFGHVVILGEKDATNSFSNILLQKIKSHDNFFDVLTTLSTGSRVTVVNSQFNNNGAEGFDVDKSSVTITDLVVISVQANENGDDGFEVSNVVNGMFVGIEANNNKDDGMDFSTNDGTVLVHDSRFCNNDDDDIFGSSVLPSVRPVYG